MIILAIETSCDETAISISRTENGNIEILSNVVSSQIELHAKWGGVVPNLAAREHLKNIIPVLESALQEAKLSQREIDLIAVTQGPGLIPALLVGVDTAKTLSYLWKKPLIGIHHIEGHIYANFIDINSKLEIQNSDINFPILCLVVSGGHTQLVLMKNHLQYEIIGQTLDDAAGEAFDKVARILGLGYPGGPAISQIAKKWKSQTPSDNNQINSDNQNLKLKINLPRPMLNSKDFNFSFSGLKTAVLYETKKHPELLSNQDYVGAVAHEFQQAVIDVLTKKTIKAARQYKATTLMLAGGVSANLELRKQIGNLTKKELVKTMLILPDTKYSIDNAAMITAAAYFRWGKMSPEKKKSALVSWKTLEANANLKLI